MSVARRLFRFGRPACISQHLCPKKWSPVLESHQPLRLCRPPPELLGQRDSRLLKPENVFLTSSGRTGNPRAKTASLGTPQTETQKRALEHHAIPCWSRDFKRFG